MFTPERSPPAPYRAHVAQVTSREKPLLSRGLAPAPPCCAGILVSLGSVTAAGRSGPAEWVEPAAIRLETRGRSGGDDRFLLNLGDAVERAKSRSQ
ncbi:hypothetical protein chiPu_0009060 [Chiloscyllium punctatum]|uniref:Uncharacterized protein n=1 Tax=Chiloscyllium punctatum TaxID=137246 RepID=A0A401SJL3_CHIPU|nr:hypothetical protein [Chiloscyllium punctatum]